MGAIGANWRYSTLVPPPRPYCRELECRGDLTPRKGLGGGTGGTGEDELHLDIFSQKFRRYQNEGLRLD